MIFGSFAAKIYSFKANVAYNQGNTQEAAVFLEKAYRTGKAKPNMVLSYGYIILKQGRLSEALKVFEEQLASPRLKKLERLNAKANYALALWKNNRLNEAIALLEEILPHFKNTNVYGSLGFFYILLGDLEKALEFNLQAYEYNSTGGVILDNLGQTCYLMGDYEKAHKYYKELMALNPKFPEAYYDYALLLEKTRDREKAVENLKIALQYKTNFLSAITNEDIENKLAELEA